MERQYRWYKCPWLFTRLVNVVSLALKTVKSDYCILYYFCCSSLQEKTCSEIKSHSSQAITGSYIIDHDGDGGYEPFTVFCDMTDKNEVGVTVISHDTENRMLVNGYEERGSFVRNVSYSGAGLTNVSQLVELLDVSAHCEQFVKYECFNTLFLFPSGNPNGWWVSRNMAKMTYWGGATSADSYKCACGVTSPNTCADPTRGCNCDKNDNSWREDSGLLTEKSPFLFCS